MSLSLQTKLEDPYDGRLSSMVLREAWGELLLAYLLGQPTVSTQLEYILHATVEKLDNQPRKKKSIPLKIGVPSSLGGIFLDLYVVVPKGTTDTLKLYFDEEIKGTLKVPKGFEFDINQTNNIYR